MNNISVDHSREDYNAQILAIEQKSQALRDKYARETRLIKWLAPVGFVVFYFAFLRFLDWLPA
jgi:hypothetical protein